MFPILLASLLATPLGWGLVDETKVRCDRMRIYSTELDVKWIICASKIYEYKTINGKKQPPVDRTLRR
jgi:hypothetical protein